MFIVLMHQDRQKHKHCLSPKQKQNIHNSAFHLPLKKAQWVNVFGKVFFFKLLSVFSETSSQT